MSKNLKKSILHLGLGRFHRGHQAVYYQKMAERGDTDWGVVSLSMRSPDARDSMREVGNRYPVIELSKSDHSIVWVDAIVETLDAQSDFQEVLEQFKSSELQLITLTITEKGYCLTSSGELDFSHSSIKADLASPSHPKSAIGLLALGLKKRFEHRGGKLTILSCDNLRENGFKLKSCLYAYLSSLKESDLLNWLEENVTFPNSMVDRIVPSLAPEKIHELEKRFSLPSDSQLIGTEAFSQWVIEDKFAGKKPQWDKVGVEFVPDVQPYEEMKLRLLNAAHSYLAYAGINQGHQYVHQAVSDEKLRAEVESLMLQEVAPMLNIPQGFNVKEYISLLLERFTNEQMPHQLKQIAMDGSQKIPQRFLPSLIEGHIKKTPVEILANAVANWLQFCWNKFAAGERLDDPLNEALNAVERKDRKGWAIKMLETSPFEPLKGYPELKEKILVSLLAFS